MNALQSRRSSDRGDSQLVTFVLVMPLLFMFVVTMIDTSIYFANRGEVQQIVRDGARQVAVLAGDGTATTRTRLEESHGMEGTCDLLADSAARTANRTEVECQVLKRWETASLTNVVVERVDCGPSFVAQVGDETYCDVRWIYGGVPGAITNFIRGEEDEPALRVNHTRITRKAETSTSGISPVPR